MKTKYNCIHPYIFRTAPKKGLIFNSKLLILNSKSGRLFTSPKN